MTRVGDNPRHKVVIPSFRAIFRSPSKVELNVRFCVSSTTHSALASAFTSPTFDSAMQYSAVLFAKKTSRQHAVTPRFAGIGLKDWRVFATTRGGGRTGCDWRRTRTTSRGVTVIRRLARFYGQGEMTYPEVKLTSSRTWQISSSAPQ